MNASSFTIGLGNESRTSSRVMQPPGGECHDLFTAQVQGSKGHHRVLKPPGGESSDIFGPAQQTNQAPLQNGHQTSFLQTNGVMNGAVNGVVNGTPPSNSAVSNPVTGEGYEDNNAAPKKRVPPGGFSTKLW